MEKYPPKTSQEKSFSELQTIKNAALLIGISYRRLLDSVNSNLVPHYKIGHSRKLVNVPEVISIMKTDGGNHA